jgi:multimeric flavodoxin WrbA
METRKILALVGSPRKGGNTDILTCRLLQSASENGAATEMIYLVDCKINPCTQCEYCHREDSTQCNVNDDFNPIVDKMLSADIIILATPIWWSTMHSLLKLLLDRCYSLVDKNWGNFKLKGKSFILITCQAQNDLNLYANPFVKEFEGYQNWLGFKVIDSVVASADTKGEVAGNTEAMNKAIALGEAIAQREFN